MAIANITTTANNGVVRITNTQTITGTGGSAGTIDGECVVLDSSASYLETGTSTGEIFITNSQIVLDSDTPTGNDTTAVLNYGGRAVTTTTFSVVDSLILAKPYTSRHNIMVTELTRSEVIESNGTGYLFCYTGTDAILDTVLFRGINVWEVYAPPSILFSVTVDDVNYGYLNWEAGRLDFFNFAVTNIARAHAWIGQGASNNASWHWNNDTTFNKEIMYLTAANNRYYEGYTATWKFIDRDTSNPIEDVLIIYRDDRSGSSALQGEMTTNSSGHMSGTFDSQNDTTGSDIERPTLFFLTAQVTTIDTSSPGAYDYPTAVITGDQGNRSYNYRIEIVSPELEVRSYLHEAPTGYGPHNFFYISAEIGSIASDLSINRYQDFVLGSDSGVTVSKTTADGYTTLTNLEQVYDRTKAEWYDNNEYPLPRKDGLKIDLKDISLEIDDSSGTAFSFSSVEATRGTVTASLSWAESTTATISAGEHRYLLVAVSHENNPLRSITSITYGGVNLTLLRKAADRNTTGTGIEVWGLDDLGITTATSTTISVSWNTAPTNYHIFRGSYTGVSQLRPVDGMVFDWHNTETVLTMNPYVETSGLGIAFAANASAGTITWEGGVTEQLESTSSGHAFAIATRGPGGSDAILSMDTTTTENIGIAIGLRATQGLITIDSGTTLATTSKFTTFKTTGAITLTDTTTIDDLAVEGDLNLAAVKDLDGVTVTNGALDFATAGTYAFSNCTINEVTNSSGGSVIINSTGSTITTNTGPNITINSIITVTITIKNQSGNPIPGAEVAIFRDNTARTVVLASTATDENGEVTTNSTANLGAIIIRVRQSAQTATFNTSAINDGTEVITTDAAHNFRDGDAVIYSSNNGGEDVNLVDGTTYYVNAITTTTLSLHATAANAIADTSRINVVNSGSETHLLDPVRYTATSATGTIGSSDFSAQIIMVTDSIVTG
jgi:hypothetical protein